MLYTLLQIQKSLPNFPTSSISTNNLNTHYKCFGVCLRPLLLFRQTKQFQSFSHSPPPLIMSNLARFTIPNNLQSYIKANGVYIFLAFINLFYLFLNLLYQTFLYTDQLLQGHNIEFQSCYPLKRMQKKSAPYRTIKFQLVGRLFECSCCFYTDPAIQ